MNALNYVFIINIIDILIKFRDEIDKKTIFLFKIANLFLRDAIMIEIIKDDINKLKKILRNFEFLVKMIKTLHLRNFK